jgi:hypothetical protein
MYIVNSQMANCINSTIFRHKLTKDNKQDTNTTDNKYGRTKQ